MTTATHSLDTTSGATTVAEILARNGARTGRVPHRRSRGDEGQFDGTLPAFPPVDNAAAQYRYDQTTVTALLEAPVVETPHEEKSRPGRTGLKIAGLAFAGAVLASGWALAQTPGSEQAAASGPVPGNTPESESPALASAPVGAQVATLGSAAPTGTAEIPATTARQPDQGKFSGTLPTAKKTTEAAAPTSTTVAPPRVSAPNLPAGTYTWPMNPGGYGNWPGFDDHHGHHRNR
ncbi:hypothetical protein [Amycolatopsis alkalitolerans]|uniref:Uncharacterized protein n=1 Tax=Amycolatopsis alkalitolerans TaxID=2547244 RepID=A0A5C4M7Y4_9PSEU|nr:hypothetical protein [Amycolatopsis alkalitolerans]TNC29587.1 hypothetical protein FG385_01070 [Amycolatopsis alkalitolerans]